MTTTEMTRVHEPLENFHQHAHVVEMQAGGGFVEQKQRSSRR